MNKLLCPLTLILVAAFACQAQNGTPDLREKPGAVQVDDANIVPTYANFCRVTGTPEELLIDFGMNPQPVGTPREPIKIHQRVVMNFYTAKRLTAALSMSITRHEAVFGELETDIAKRIKERP